MLASNAYSKSAWLREPARARDGRARSRFAGGAGRALATVLSCALAGCATQSATLGPQAQAIAAARVQKQATLDRPLLVRVEREGDPSPGVAVAVHVSDGSVAALGLSRLVEDRLRSVGLERFEARASAAGFIIQGRVESSDEVARFIRESNRALVTAVTPAEVERVAAELRLAPPIAAAAASEVALARCSGELLAGPGEDPAAAASRSLGGWLGGVGALDVAFAVVGPRRELDAAPGIVAGLPAWRRAGGRRLEPEEDVFGSASASGGPDTLSLALWGVPAPLAAATVERLGELDSLLALRVQSGFPEWRVTRVASQLVRGGACLRVDLQSESSGQNAEAIASAARETLEEIGHTLARTAPQSWLIARQVLAMDSAEQAAAVAAWHSLTTPYPPAQGAGVRRFVHYSGDMARALTPERLRGLLAEEPRRSAIETRHAIEAGQGRYWLMVASPCGTGAEDASNAGTLAVTLRALALAHDGRNGVRLEPWLTVDGMGLVAHAVAAGPQESPEQQAERVAEALARALAGKGPEPIAVQAARSGLLEQIEHGSAPTYTLVLRQSTGDHPSWLEPRGTWPALSALSVQAVQLGRRAFLRGRLRAASLGTLDERQIDAGERRLLNLLRASGPADGECPARRAIPPNPGKYRVQTSGPLGVDAMISVPLPGVSRGVSEEALWTEILMNRPDGWLHQALTRPGLVSTARARVLGGSTLAALIIEIQAVDGKREEAVAQVRGLFERLRAGAATAEDVRVARDVSERHEAERQRNPRARLIEVWHGARRQSASLESLHALHQSVFEPGREVVVVAEPSQ